MKDTMSDHTIGQDDTGPACAALAQARFLRLPKSPFAERGHSSQKLGLMCFVSNILSTLVRRHASARQPEKPASRPVEPAQPTRSLQSLAIEVDIRLACRPGKPADRAKADISDTELLFYEKLLERFASETRI